MFIRLSLNENSLSDYLNALAWNKALTEQYYDRSAIMRNSEEFGLVVDSIKRLCDNLHFVLWTKDDDGVDNPRYWEIAKRVPSQDKNVVLALPEVSELELARKERITKQRQIKNGTDTPNISESPNAGNLERSTGTLNSPQNQLQAGPLNTSNSGIHSPSPESSQKLSESSKIDRTKPKNSGIHSSSPESSQKLSESSKIDRSKPKISIIKDPDTDTLDVTQTENHNTPPVTVTEEKKDQGIFEFSIGDSLGTSIH